MARPKKTETESGTASVVPNTNTEAQETPSVAVPEPSAIEESTMNDEPIIDSDPSADLFGADAESFLDETIAHGELPPQPETPPTEPETPPTEPDVVVTRSEALQRAEHLVRMIDEAFEEFGDLEFADPEVDSQIRALNLALREAIEMNDETRAHDLAVELVDLAGKELAKKQAREASPAPVPVRKPSIYRVVEDGRLVTGGYVRMIRKGSTIDETSYDMSAVNAAVAKGWLKIEPA